MNIVASGKTIDHTLVYRSIRFHKEELGRLPNDIFLPTEQTPPLDSLKKVRPVIVHQPEFVNHQPNVREVRERFQASAPSPLAGGTIGAIVGGVVGAVVGGFASVLSGNGAFLFGGGALGVAAGSFLGVKNATAKEVQLVVRERPILAKAMTGTDTRVSRGSLKGKSGYFHSFSAHLETTQHGMYDVPTLQTVRKASS
jgi:hypothetical protein